MKERQKKAGTTSTGWHTRILISFVVPVLERR